MVAPATGVVTHPRKEGIVPQTPLWNVEQVSTYLNVGKTTIYGLVNSGALKTIKIGRSTRFDPAQVMEFVGSQ